MTPDHLHRDVVEVAIANGARGIFCEKPIATTLEDADAIVAAVRGGGRDRSTSTTPAAGSPSSSRRAGWSGPARSAGCRRSSSRWVARGRCCSATTPTRIDLVNFLADSPSRLGVGRARARVRGLRHRPTPATAATTRPPSPVRNYYIAYENGVRAYAHRHQGHGRRPRCRSTCTDPRAGSSSTCWGSACMSVYNEDIRAPSRACRPSSRSRHAGRSPGCRPASWTSSLRMDEGRDPASPPESARDDGRHHPGHPAVAGARQRQGPSRGARRHGTRPRRPIGTEVAGVTQRHP